VTARPSKPWRVILTGPDITAESAHSSEAKAYGFVRASLGPGSPAHTAKVMQWEDGRWWHYETLHTEDLITEETP
jgi:hypothetical protein